MNQILTIIPKIALIDFLQDYKYLFIYLIAINLISFIFFAVDKYKSINNKWRIPEITLLGLSLIGGSIGGLLAMNIYRHKTRKFYFKYGLPLMLLLQIAVILYVLKQ